MNHDEIFKLFKQIAHVSDERIEAWYPNGLNSVRVLLKSGNMLVLTYESFMNWRLETINSFREWR